MKKRILATALVLALSMGLMACAGTNNNQTTSAGDVTKQSETAAITSEASETTTAEALETTTASVETTTDAETAEVETTSASETTEAETTTVIETTTETVCETEAPTTVAPTTAAPTTEAPTTAAPTKEEPSQVSDEYETNSDGYYTGDGLRKDFTAKDGQYYKDGYIFNPAQQGGVLNVYPVSGPFFVLEFMDLNIKLASATDSSMKLVKAWWEDETVCVVVYSNQQPVNTLYKINLKGQIPAYQETEATTKEYNPEWKWDWWYANDYSYLIIDVDEGYHFVVELLSMTITKKVELGGKTYKSSKGAELIKGSFKDGVAKVTLKCDGMPQEYTFTVKGLK